jgi:hypothetical protein
MLSAMNSLECAELREEGGRDGRRRSWREGKEGEGEMTMHR